MISRPNGIGAFEFVVLASLRAAQLMRGCRPRIDGDHTVAVAAQMEIADGSVVGMAAVSKIVVTASNGDGLDLEPADSQ